MIIRINKGKFKISTTLSISILIFVLVLGGYAFELGAAEMESSNYKVESSSINVGGRGESSANYKMQETIGEIGTGLSQSENYQLNAGFQQMQVTFISISSPSDVSMSPSIPGISGGSATGTVAWTVITDNSAGYSLTIAAATSPALISGANNFADYTQVSASTPDYSWQVAAADSEFGFTVEGSDTAQKFKDNGTDTCGQGSSETADKCWYSLSTSDLTISSRSSSNHPTGTASTVKFKAESGTNHLQVAGTYTATITVTATTL